jgi:tRNA-specific 2-thiouridylase
LFRKAIYRKSEVHWIRTDMTLANGSGGYGKNTLQTTFAKATLHQFENGMYVSFQNHNQLLQKGSLLPGI